jgi:hypothetical protein
MQVTQSYPVESDGGDVVQQIANRVPMVQDHLRFERGFSLGDLAVFDQGLRLQQVIGVSFQIGGEFRAPGQPLIRPERFADALNLRIQDLAKLAGVHRTTVTETPGNARLQRFLREALRALSAAYEVTRDRDRSIFWFRNTPIPEFGHRTAETIVAEGKTDAVIAYLTSIAAGSSG